MRNSFILFPRYCLVFFLVVLTHSCSEDEVVEPLIEPLLTPYQESVISYFKEIALGFEYGGASEITRKWVIPMKIFVEGDNINDFHLNVLNETIEEINNLSTDGFSLEISEDSLISNCHIYLGSTFKSHHFDVPENIGKIAYVNVTYDNDRINRATIFVDTYIPNQEVQRSLIIEELTQSLGLGKDSPRYPKSIFYETPLDGGSATEYLPIDKDLIRLLYHPKMIVGLNHKQVDLLLREILIEENGI